MGNRWASDNFIVLLFGYLDTGQLFLYPLLLSSQMIYFKPLHRQGVQYLVRSVMKCIIYVTPNGTIYESDRVSAEVVVTCFRANYLRTYMVKLISSMKKFWSRCPGCRSI
jgi:hypothetical protein